MWRIAPYAVSHRVYRRRGDPRKSASVATAPLAAASISQKPGAALSPVRSMMKVAIRGVNVPNKATARL